MDEGTSFQGCGGSCISIQLKCQTQKVADQREHQPLIPGLPDDLGFQCLIRSSRYSIPSFRMVCLNWREVLMDPATFAWRRQMGLGDEWLYMCGASTRFDQRFDWYCFVPDLRSWLILPPMPLDNDHGWVRTTGFGVTAVDGLGLFIAGGSAEGRGLLHVTVFDFRSSKWSSIHSPYFTPRVDPVVVSVANDVYIAGGKDGTHARMADTMLAIDAATHCVTKISSREPVVGLVWCETLKFGRFLYARSRRDCLFGASAEGGVVLAFDPDTKEWFQCSTATSTVSKAWKSLMAPLGGSLYMMDSQLCLWKWEEGVGGSWVRVGGTLRFGFVLKKILACAGRLYAVVYSADSGMHTMLEVELSSSKDGALPMTPVALPGKGYFSAIACSRM